VATTPELLLKWRPARTFRYRYLKGRLGVVVPATVATLCMRHGGSERPPGIGNENIALGRSGVQRIIGMGQVGSGVVLLHVY